MIQYRLSLLLLTMIGAVSINIEARQVVETSNVLRNIFHHQGAGSWKQTATNNNGSGGAALGQVVLYFSEKPIEKRGDVGNTESGMKELIFLFPVKKISADAQAILDKGSVFKTKSYSVTITAVPDDIKVVVSFDAQTTNLFSAWFESIGDKNKGWVFRFFDKKSLNSMSDPNKPVLRTASGKHGVVIDCGHGGIDMGACHFNLQEKNITLEIGQQLASLLRKQGYAVFLTRDTDATMPLDARTSFANRMVPDLCVSIHANAGRATAAGIETYCLNENLLYDVALYPADLHYKQALKLLAQDRWQQSMRLAQSIQSNVMLSVKKKADVVIDRGVKTAVSQMLMGVTSPSVIVEVGFLSNKSEAALLSDATYQRLLAEGMCKGIKEYFGSDRR